MEGKWFKYKNIGSGSIILNDKQPKREIDNKRTDKFFNSKWGWFDLRHDL